MDNKNEKCKFCGSEKKIIVFSFKENNDNYGYACLECLFKKGLI